METNTLINRELCSDFHLLTCTTYTLKNTAVSFTLVVILFFFKVHSIFGKISFLPTGSDMFVEIRVLHCP